MEVSNINSCYEVKCQTGDVENYVREILTLNLCKLFFPVTFTVEGDEISGSYKIEGFKKLSVVNYIGTEDILSIVISLLKDMASCENHYIFCDEYEIDEDTVFVDKSYFMVKMIYRPCSQVKTGPERLLDLINQLKVKTSEEGLPYIEAVTEYISNNNFSYSSVIHYLEKMRKEVYLCGIQ